MIRRLIDRVPDRLWRLVKFGLVGVSGIGVNTFALFLFSGLIGVHYLVGVVMATQASTAWNFTLSDIWVFDRATAEKGLWRRFWMFWALNNSALLLRGPIVFLLTDVASVHYLLSNLISLVVVMLARFGLSDVLIWRQRDPASVA